MMYIYEAKGRRKKNTIIRKREKNLTAFCINGKPFNKSIFIAKIVTQSLSTMASFLVFVCVCVA